MLKEFKRDIKRINQLAKETDRKKPIVGEIKTELFVDDYGNESIEYLNTEYNIIEGELNIIHSDRYTDDDIKKYGQEKVLEWIKGDEKYYNDFMNGNIWMNGLQAIAKIYLPNTSGGYTVQKITSGSVFGISSDSTEEDLQEIKEDLFYELEKYLKMLGCVINE